MRTLSMILTIAACCAASEASAQPATLGEATSGYTYFNRPGADAAAHETDLHACAADATNIGSVYDSFIRTKPYRPGMIQMLHSRAAFVSGVENCMVVKGWRVVRIPQSEGESLSERASADVAARIAPWIGADHPYGEIVRVWNNDAAHASTDRFEPRPDWTRNGSLSIVAVSSISLGTIRTADSVEATQQEQGSRRRQEFRPPNALRTWLDSKWPREAIEPIEFAEAPPEAAILIVRVTGLSLQNGNGIMFMREWPDPDTPPSRIDRGPDTAEANVPLLANRREGNWRAFAVPAGRWRVASMNLIPALSFCLGAPAFEVRAGEVVYAGTFDLAAENIGPNLSLDPVRAWLAGQSAAETVRAAEYTNGWTSRCLGNAIYAFEIEGVPFREGYTWGGALNRAASTQTATPSE